MAGLRPLLSLILLIGTAFPALAAGSYTLVAGDRLEIEYSAAEAAVEAIVDADGQVRLAELGGVTIRGLTLDDAELRIEREMEAQGVFVDPRVSLAMLEYAPVTVAGDVASPGSYAYVPGMTIASALGMSGGGQAGNMTRGQIARARAAAESEKRTTNLDIAATAVELARHRTVLEGDEADLTLPEDLRAQIPVPDAVNIEGLLADEHRILEAQRTRTRNMLRFWDEEIAGIRNQTANYDDRISVQQEIVESASEELASMRDLQERGLQTADRVADAEQRDANARSRVLELEAAKIDAQQAVSNAEREREQFLSDIRERALDGQRDARVALGRLQLRHERYAEEIALLSGGNAGALLASDAIALTFRLQTTREGRPDDDDLTLRTPVLPGETLIVAVVPASDVMDG